MSESTTSATTDTTDEQVTTARDTDDKHWYVEDGAYVLAKTSYSEYELKRGGVTTVFERVREDDDTGHYELKESHNTHGYFDPDGEDVPAAIRAAFLVLVNES
jgi:hypothetical protein